MAYEIPVTRARAELADLINRVVYAGERVVVTRHGKPLVALVSAADLRRLEGCREPAGQTLEAVSGAGDVPSAHAEPGSLGLAAEQRAP
ncbi:type II toxin-antitoxin system Phd/YefM family antitoxin [Streptomyces sennicomposti]|uniref:type II toxin-antitoxin system Phd/YefM family antitoxin n=1 Tax=Streptomyces TaxID=1883 RepID=UPI001CA7A422|nr:type II toxin-antitoxin system Phd/YefM family antitoxin [Streptomyces sennicomposti]MBY8864866.1 type II toxin-antitoxin system Phd/YefM family antitoxin [Streptomyces sennicomposti]